MLNFIMENQIVFFIFLLNRPMYLKKQNQNEQLSQFLDKIGEKVIHEKT